MPPIETYEIPLPPPLVLANPAVYAESPRPSLDLPYEDVENLESNWHRLQMNLLIDIIESVRADAEAERADAAAELADAAAELADALAAELARLKAQLANPS